MGWGGVWKNVGKGLVVVAKASAKGALWASQHPEVVAGVATIAGHPEVAAVIGVIPKRREKTTDLGGTVMDDDG